MQSGTKSANLYLIKMCIFELVACFIYRLSFTVIYFLMLFRLVQMGLVYVFNLIVGTGALTLPAVFDRAGWVLGLCLICVLALIR